jgi:hypothetical protein
MREKYCWLVAGGWFVVREKYCWLVADKPSEQGANGDRNMYRWRNGMRSGGCFQFFFGVSCMYIYIFFASISLS